MAETVARTLVVEDQIALVRWCAAECPEMLRVPDCFLESLAEQGLAVANTDSDGRFQLIAPSGSIVAGVWLDEPGFPEGDGNAEPENNDG